MSHHVPLDRGQRVPVRLAGLAGLLGAALLVVGCSAGPVTPSPGSSPPGSSTPGSSTLGPSSPGPSASTPTNPSQTAPEDGESLRDLGFTHGPAAFTVPTGTVLATSADQDQQVTLVISSPTPADVSAYLVRTLPQTGFTIGRQQADAIEFSGHGWSGSFVATGAISAVTLQPA